MCHSATPLTKGSQGGAREGVIQIAGLTAEDEGIGVGAEETVDEIHVPRILEDANRVLLRVGVEIPDDENLVVPRSRGIRREPLEQALRRGDARQVAVSLAVTDVRVVPSVGPSQGEPLDLK